MTLAKLVNDLDSRQLEECEQRFSDGGIWVEKQFDTENLKEVDLTSFHNSEKNLDRRNNITEASISKNLILTII